jgi:hypothetical protein
VPLFDEFAAGDHVDAISKKTQVSNA